MIEALRGPQVCDEPEVYGGLAKMARRLNLPDRLRAQKKQLEAQLENVNNALKLVEDNPTLVDFIQALEKVNTGY